MGSAAAHWKVGGRKKLDMCSLIVLFFSTQTGFICMKKKKGIEEEKFVSMSMVFHMLALS